MGWFDKRSWQLRGKIKDLQADLIAAEEQGKFIVEQGLFFAELEDMGEATMMVFGATDEIQSSEADIIRNFFERNGFQVETVKLDRSHTGLADAEIIPPEEFTRHIGKALKADGWRLVDDSEDERSANIAEKVYPLSALIRSIAILFAEQVRSVTARTRIKMNKEGNRLLHWMPKIVEAIGRKCPPATVDVCRPHFDDAYAIFYGSVISRREGSSLGPASTDGSRIPGLAFGAGSPAPSPQARPANPMPSPLAPAPVLPMPMPIPSSNPAPPPGPPPMPMPQLGSPTFRPTLPPRPEPAGPPRPAQPFAPQSESIDLPLPPAPTVSKPAPSPQQAAPTPPPGPINLPFTLAPPPAPATHAKAHDAASPAEDHAAKVAGLETLANLYKKLIGTNSSRCVRNSEGLLEMINKSLNASATCIMKKIPGTSNISIHAQAGQKLSWGEGAEGVGFPISSSTISECLRTRTTVTREQAEDGDENASMVLHSIQCSAAVPIVWDGDVLGVLYVDRRGGLRPFTPVEKDLLARYASVFSEFAEMTLGVT